MSISELTHVSEPVRRIELFTGHGRRRTWSVQDKAAIVAESYLEGESVCGVARRHGLTPQQLFTWRRGARKAVEALPAFVPAVIVPEPAAVKPEAAKPPQRRTKRRTSRRRAGVIALDVAGVRVTIENGASPDTIAAVIGALKTTP
jgi:transposase